MAITNSGSFGSGKKTSYSGDLVLDAKRAKNDPLATPPMISPLTGKTTTSGVIDDRISTIAPQVSKPPVAQPATPAAEPTKIQWWGKGSLTGQKQPTIPAQSAPPVTINLGQSASPSYADPMDVEQFFGSNEGATLQQSLQQKNPVLWKKYLAGQLTQADLAYLKGLVTPSPQIKLSLAQQAHEQQMQAAQVAPHPTPPTIAAPPPAGKVTGAPTWPQLPDGIPYTQAWLTETFNATNPDGLSFADWLKNSPYWSEIANDPQYADIVKGLGVTLPPTGNEYTSEQKLQAQAVQVAGSMEEYNRLIAGGLSDAEIAAGVRPPGESSTSIPEPPAAPPVVDSGRDTPFTTAPVTEPITPPLAEQTPVDSRALIQSFRASPRWTDAYRLASPIIKRAIRNMEAGRATEADIATVNDWAASNGLSVAQATTVVTPPASNAPGDITTLLQTPGGIRAVNSGAPELEGIIERATNGTATAEDLATLKAWITAHPEGVKEPVDMTQVYTPDNDGEPGMTAEEEAALRTRYAAYQAAGGTATWEDWSRNDHQWDAPTGGDVVPEDADAIETQAGIVLPGYETGITLPADGSGRKTPEEMRATAQTFIDRMTPADKELLNDWLTSNDVDIQSALKTGTLTQAQYDRLMSRINTMANPTGRAETLEAAFPGWTAYQQSHPGTTLTPAQWKANEESGVIQSLGNVTAVGMKGIQEIAKTYDLANDATLRELRAMNQQARREMEATGGVGITKQAMDKHIRELNQKTNGMLTDAKIKNAVAKSTDMAKAILDHEQGITDQIIRMMEAAASGDSTMLSTVMGGMLPGLYKALGWTDDQILSQMNVIAGDAYNLSAQYLTNGKSRADAKKALMAMTLPNGSKPTDKFVESWLDAHWHDATAVNANEVLPGSVFLSVGGANWGGSANEQNARMNLFRKFASDNAATWASKPKDTVIKAIEQWLIDQKVVGTGNAVQDAVKIAMATALYSSMLSGGMFA